MNIELYHSYCVSGDVDALTQIMNTGNIELNGLFYDGLTLAVQHQHPTVVDYLLTTAEKSLHTFDFQSSFLTACSLGDAAMVSLFIKHMLPLKNIQRILTYGLQHAIESQQYHLVDILLEHALSRDTVIYHSITEFCHANNADAVKYLFDVTPYSTPQIIEHNIFHWLDISLQHTDKELFSVLLDVLALTPGIPLQMYFYYLCEKKYWEHAALFLRADSEYKIRIPLTHSYGPWEHLEQKNHGMVIALLEHLQIHDPYNYMEAMVTLQKKDAALYNEIMHKSNSLDEIEIML